MLIALLLACSEVSVRDATQPPVVTLLQPVSDGQFDPLGTVEVCARVAWDGDVDALDAVLVSDVDGTLTTDFSGCADGDLGAVVSLSDSAHVLALSVTDPANRTATADARITPVDNQLPSCIISSPLPGTVVGEGASLALDVVPNDADDDGLSIEVESSLDGVVGSATWTDGIASFTPTLTAGTHTLVVTVEDPRGAAGTCSTLVEVAACLDDDSDGFDTCIGDCDDDDPDVYPGAPEVADGVDNDCNGTTDEGTELFDDDGDGATELAGDCDDTDATVNPGATETPDDGIDQDCSGSDAAACFADTDDDGHGDGPLLSEDADCTDLGESDLDDDCDDTDPSISPSALEILSDGIDQDCDGIDPDGCFEDADLDGFGSMATIPSGDGDCDDPGESLTGDDCNDTLDTVFPGAPELPDTLDNDCDGTVDEGTDNFDDDGDGFTENENDCDDADDAINPDAMEVPEDGIDQDCSGTDAVVCFADGDGDDFGDGTVISEDLDCSDGGEAAVEGDCDDGDAQVNPGELEIPGDGIDQNCDGTDSAACFADTDDDGFGSATPLPPGDGDCDDPGESDFATDCDDGDGGRFPGNTEVPDDGIDQDCSGADTVTCYLDGDGDSFAGDGIALEEAGCSVNSPTSDDCDDTDENVFPGAAETPDDGIDQDCNLVDATSCFVDGDFDGFGRDVDVVALDGTCDTADNESALNTDCDDTLSSVNPDGTEVVDDGIDQDCSGTDSITCPADGDGDDYGDGTVVSLDDDCTDAGEGAVADGDCDDGDASINPGATEIPDDGIDQDCSGVDSVTCFVDLDDDEFGIATTVLGEGGCGSQLAALDGDCDDGDDTVFPGAADPLGDGNDTNCDSVDGVDADGDGFATGPDCDDSDPDVYPGGPELHDGEDNNCNGSCDEGLIGYGDLVVSELLIDPNAGGEPNEYFELYNASGVPIRFCSDWTFSDQDADSFSVSDPALVVAPGGYVVLGKTLDLGGVDADYVYGGSMALANGGDELEVFFEGVEIDTLVWSSAFDAQGESQEAALLDADANDSPANWCDSIGTFLTGDLGTPGEPNTCP